MNARSELKALASLTILFATCFFLPIGSYRFENAVLEGLALTKWYTRQYLLLTLIPAFLVAGAIGAFVNRESVLRYLGARANKLLAYGVAAVSGAVIAVCSCAVLPLFSGIHKKGAGIGPATAFLYSGPAINILAIVLTARVLGVRLGLARALAAIVFSVVIGLLMQFFFRNDGSDGEQTGAENGESDVRRSAWQTVLVFATMIGVMIFSNWARSGDVRAVLLCCPGGLTTYEIDGHILEQTGTRVVILDSEGREITVTPEEVQEVKSLKPNSVGRLVYRLRWELVGALGVLLASMLWHWYSRAELADWIGRSWGFAKRMLPPLILGVLAAGFLMGGQENEGLIPRPYIEMLVGSSPKSLLSVMDIPEGTTASIIGVVWTLWTNFFASIVGVFMYFATLTEVPIVRGLMRSGMGKGPALALLLAGPAVSLPNMLVIRSVIGTRKTVTYIALVVTMATVSGMIYGAVTA